MMTFGTIEEASAELPSIARDFNWPIEQLKIARMSNQFYIIDPWGSPV